MRIENPVLATVFFVLAVIFAIDLGGTSPGIVNGRIVDKRPNYSGYQRSNFPHCDVSVLTSAGSTVQIRTDVNTCKEFNIGDVISTETSSIFNRTATLKFNGKTRSNMYAGFGIAVLFACIASLALSFGSCTLKISEK